MSKIFFNRLTFPSLLFYRWAGVKNDHELDPEIAGGLLLREILAEHLPVALPRALAIDNEGEIGVMGWGADLEAQSALIRKFVPGATVQSREIAADHLSGQLAFRLKCSPTIRRAGAEIDAWVARRAAEPELERATAYAEWLAGRIKGARITDLGIAKAGAAEIKLPNQAPFMKPSALLEGRIQVDDPISLMASLTAGIGRHGTLGFGAPILSRA